MRRSERQRDPRLRDDPAVRRKWRRTSRLKRYGLTQKAFEGLLELQDYACGMCAEMFLENSVIFVDHDHACCPGTGSCGKCVRGLLCLSCNTYLGHMEQKRKLELARVYLAAPPARMATNRVA